MLPMNEELINRIMVAVAADVPQERLNSVRTRVCVVLDDYDVAAKSKELSTFVRPYPACYEYFIVTKKIEGASPKTLNMYRIYLEDMFNSLRKPMNDITPNDIRVYLYTVQQQRQISNRSLDNRRSVLSSFFSWSAAEGYIDKNPMTTIKPIKYDKKERKPIGAIDMEAIRMACTDIREQALIELLYSTACRVTEMERLNIADVDFVTNEVRLFGKGNKHRVSYMSPRAKLYLQQYLATRHDNCPALFISARGHERLRKSGIERLVKIIGERAGVGNIFPHLLRHTSATDALQKGMDITQVQKMLGHAGINTTMVYAKVAVSDVRASHGKYYT